MASITDIVLSDIDSISNEYTKNIAEPSHVIKQVSEQIRSDGKFICSFDAKELPANTSMVAIDGGNASEKLAGGDLIVSAATLGEAIKSSRLYDTPDDIPSEVFSTIISHTSSNDKIEKAMRALLELRILTQTKSNIKIIDGAYLGNVSAVLYALMDKEHKVSNAILEHASYDEDKLLEKAFKEILYPPRGKGNGIIAVPKSDSSTYFINHVLAEYGLKDLGLTDRILASRILKPGEFFSPRNLVANPGLVAGLTKGIAMPNFGDKSSNKAALMKIVNDKAGLFRRLGTENTEEGLLWTTYFKPHAWNEFAPAIKIEFVFYPGDTKIGNRKINVVEKATELIQYIDQDIVDQNVLEPWCQYQADLGAKQVSVAINILKAHILNNVSTVQEAAGMLKGYRT